MSSDDGSSQPLLSKSVAVPEDDKVMHKADPSTFRVRLHEFVTGKSATGVLYDEFSNILIWSVVIAYIIITVPEYAEYKTDVDTFGLISALMFLCEYLARLWSSCEDEDYGKSRFTFLFSWISILDIVTVVPYIISVLAWPQHENGTQFLRVLKLFVRFSGNKGSSEAGRVISEVVSNASWLLLSTFYFLVAVWLMLAACYHITERNNPDVGGRFDDFTQSMWWTLVNLLGEFPLSTQLSPYGKVVGIFCMIFAIGGVQGITTGIISDGYSKVATADREGAEDGEDDDDEELLPIVELELKSSGVQIDSEDAMDRAYLFINAYTTAGSFFEGTIMVLVICNVLMTMLDTMHSVSSHESWKAFSVPFEAASVGIFTVEYLIRLYAIGAHKKHQGLQGRFVWATTNFFALVDVVAIVPFYIDLCIAGDNIIPTTFVRVFRLFRIFRLFKAGKFVEGMNVIHSAVMDKSGLLSMLFYGVSILWILFSVLMFYTERNNPIKSVAEQFNTIPRSMWITLLNFTGEYPIGDYTNAGKLVSSCVAFVAITIFGIPVAVISDGMSDKFARLDEVKRRNEIEEEDDEANYIETMELARGNCNGELFLFMQGQDLQLGDVTEEDPWWETWGVRFEISILMLIVINTVLFIIKTVNPFAESKYDVYFDNFETFSVVIYSCEFLMRCVATFGDPRLKNVWYAPAYPLSYWFSFFGLIDVVAILPWYLSHFVSGVSNNLTVLRVARLIRILRVERYLPVFSLFGRVFKQKYYSLAASVFTMLICTIVFSTLLHQTEKDNHQTETASHYAMSYRYRSVPSSLFYTFIHLTGDYPLLKYSSLGRVVNFFMIMIGVVLVGIPLGIIVEGFQEVLQNKIEAGDEARETMDEDPAAKEASAEETAAEEEASAEDLSKDEDETADDLSKDEGETAASEEGSATGSGSGSACLPTKARRRPSPRDSWVSEGLVYGEIPSGPTSTSVTQYGTGASSGAADEAEDWAEVKLVKTKEMELTFAVLNYSVLFDYAQLSMIVLTVAGIAVESNADWRVETGGKICLMLQRIACGFFATEYFLRLFACPADPKFEGLNEFSGVHWKHWRAMPRFCYATDFTGMIDLLAWFPFMVAQFFTQGSTWNVVMCMLQIICVVKLDRRLPAFTLLDDVVASGDTGRLLLCAGALSLMLWVLFAAVLFIIEEKQPEMDGAFENMPESLFVTIILIGGEWCRIDLTVPWGQITGALLALVGIGIIGIPVAVFFDGYAEISEDYVDKYISPEEDEEKSVLPTLSPINRAK